MVFLSDQELQALFDNSLTTTAIASYVAIRDGRLDSLADALSYTDYVNSIDRLKDVGLLTECSGGEIKTPMAKPVLLKREV